MNPMQVEYFRQKLHKWRKTVLQESSETLKHLKEETSGIADPSDRATIETEHALELRTRDRQRKLLLKIDQALERIDSGIYGFCEITGTPISLSRLEARPIATMSIEAQELHEKKEKVQNND
ncbi:MAG: RNA polymerase-binding protein DksA [Pseudomonadota bacterium]|nr:RNA polymerase-binding protein DksA [Pseudomonadota bacterium]MEC8877463.1 RNA polymerase-binding protein DksA [Pseudomonadota bacterium]MED5339126.1 RNA polymerase-binding protein DksA [Pseudomonadota bacterium]MEE3206658.1 RNA polymerase-binding protein DksA [Pseudomonadota bacterium]